MLKELEENDELTTSVAIGQRLGWLSLTLVVTTVVMTVATCLVATAFATDLGPGCAPDRPAIAHHAGGVIALSLQAQQAPIPCSTATGWRTSEPSIAVSNAGAVLFQPALSQSGLNIGLVRSVNQGETWDFVPHAPQTPPVTDAIDQNFWIDRKTGRAFWISIDLPSPTPPRLDRSDDGGKTWFRSNQPCPNRAISSPVGPYGCGHPQIVTGPPTKSMAAKLQGYPNVVYVCAGGADPLACQKSLDGGMTFGPPLTLPSPAGIRCPGFVATHNFGLNAVIGGDGTVYVPFTPCQAPYIAISHDEGETWQTPVLVADTLTLGFGLLSLDQDEAGNLYAGWIGFTDRLPYLSVSRDGGSHWSTPMMIGAPGVVEVALPGLVSGARGQVAVTYMGSKNAFLPFPPSCDGLSTSCPGYQNETWDTYITETFNALDRDPVFFSATLNDPTRPTWYGCSPSEIGYWSAPGTACTARAGNGPTLSGRLDYYGSTMASDGTPWVGFVQECPSGLPVAGNPNCPSTLTGTNTDSLLGFVGRLVQVN
jgi:hypothetical protein